MTALFLRLLKRLGFATALRRLGMAGLVADLNRCLLVRARYRAARPHLHGRGLEIGALDFPLPLPNGVVARYVDNKTSDENLQRCPGANSDRVLAPDLVEDGFLLASVPTASEDFVIANHVLEHAPDPLGTLRHWTRVIRRGGCIFLTVPVAEKCFDRTRPLTPLEHLQEDYRQTASGDLVARQQRDRAHYLEWATLSEPEAAVAPDGPALLSREGQIARAEQLWADSVDIHFHTFSPASLAAMLGHFTTEIDCGITVVELKPCGGEIVAVLKRSD